MDTAKNLIKHLTLLSLKDNMATISFLFIQPSFSYGILQ